MRKNGFPSIFLLPVLGCIIFLSACESTLTIDLPLEPVRIVALCNFTTDRPFQVTVSKSKALSDDSDFEYPSEATVAIYKDSVLLEYLHFVSATDGGIPYWIGSSNPEPGIRYELRVSVPGIPDVYAESFLPQPVSLLPINVDNLSLKPIFIDSLHKEYYVPIELHIPPFLQNNQYYSMRIYHEIEDIETVDGNTVVVSRHFENTNLFPNKITSSFLHPIYDNSYLVDHKYWGVNNFSLPLQLLIPYRIDTQRPTKVYIEWRTVTEDYYRYYFSVSRQSPDIPFSEPAAVYNNVRDGYGNFSGYSVYRDSITLR